jgi:hypothetical protein
MEYFTLLALATVVITLLAAGLYRRSRDLGVVAGVCALYYWSLYGGWFVVIDKLGGSSGQHYHYLEYKMFPLALDGFYMASLATYAGFIVVVELALLLMLPTAMSPPVSPEGKNREELPRLVLRHEPILIIGILAGLASYFVIREKLSTAWALNTSAYWYTRAQTGPWFTLHQVLNRVALVPAAIGLATLAAGNRSRFFINAAPRYVWPGYTVLLGGMGAFTFVLGNKNEVFTALISGVLAYAGSLRRPDWRKLGVAFVVGLWFLTAIDFFRGTPISRISEVLLQRYSESTDVGHFVASSNEAFAAHFSMYGVLATGTEPKFGYSLYSLVCSIIPRVLWPDRPPDIYLYYSQSVGAIENQGYSLHHATGWYLNFGYPGVAIGAMVLGLLWAQTLSAKRRIRKSTGLLFRLAAIIGPWLFAAGLPPLIRSGPEGYKGFVLECLLIPLGVLVLACRPQDGRSRIQQPKTICRQVWAAGDAAMGGAR